MGEPPDHIFLWRLLAHRPNPTLTALTEICPELDRVGPVLPALPSDRVLLTQHDESDGKYWRWRTTSTVGAVRHLADAVRLHRLPPDTAAARAALLGLPTVAPQELTGDAGAELARTPVVEAYRGDRVGEDRPVTVADLIRAAEQGADRLTALGFTLARPLPPDADTADLRILLTPGHDEPWLSTDRPVPYQHLLHVVATTGTPLGEVLGRLRAYGFDIPLRLPARPTALDRALLKPYGPCEWWGVLAGRPMPFAHLVVAARSLHTNPRDLAARLLSYGVETSCRDLPDGLSFDTALLLLAEDGSEDAFLTADSSPTLQQLLDRSRALRVPLHQVGAWLDELGIPVPDLAITLRAALARVPLAAG
ncbi:hypothetical protein [Kitasatospora sp. NPDC088346]|uniref:wHTH domain-containing protein n=1 Tax=Kitasatospora sp. NPDC088346 TaxID=3364073 RepID=UPI00380CB965